MPGTAEVQVRPGVEEDLKPLTDLYNHYVRETPITFDTEPFTRRSADRGCSPTLKTARTA